MSRRVVVVGGGIVGVALAGALMEAGGVAVTVLERGPRGRLLGSTGHAPGFVGLPGEAPVATELPRASAAEYEQLEHDGKIGFERVGGLEVAVTDNAMADLARRAALAAATDLPARILTARRQRRAQARRPAQLRRRRAVSPQARAALADASIAVSTTYRSSRPPSSSTPSAPATKPPRSLESDHAPQPQTPEQVAQAILDLITTGAEQADLVPEQFGGSYKG